MKDLFTIVAKTASFCKSTLLKKQFETKYKGDLCLQEHTNERLLSLFPRYLSVVRSVSVSVSVSLPLSRSGLK